MPAAALTPAPPCTVGCPPPRGHLPEPRGSDPADQSDTWTALPASREGPCAGVRKAQPAVTAVGALPTTIDPVQQGHRAGLTKGQGKPWAPPRPLSQKPQHDPYHSRRDGRAGAQQQPRRQSLGGDCMRGEGAVLPQAAPDTLPQLTVVQGRQGGHPFHWHLLGPPGMHQA